MLEDHSQGQGQGPGSDTLEALIEGARVSVHGNHGTVRFIGETKFAPGTWVGVELDAPSGKNNGIVDGVRYFDCKKSPTPENRYGIFVRKAVIEVLPKAAAAPTRSVNKSRVVSDPYDDEEAPLTPAKRSTKLSMSLRSASRVASDAGGALAIPPLRSSSSLVYPTSRSPTRSTSRLVSLVTSPTKKNHGQRDISNGSSVLSSGNEDDEGDAAMLVREIETLRSKLKVIERKRRDDLEKIKLLQSESQKVHRYENVVQRLQLKLKSSLDELQSLRTKLKELEQLQGTSSGSLTGSVAADEELLELATLDKEMAEERADTLQLEVNALKTKVDQLTLDCEILKEENDLLVSDTGNNNNGDDETTTIASLQMRNKKLEVALLKLREINIAQEKSYKDQNKTLEKQTQDLKDTQTILDATKKQLDNAESIIVDLRTQLDNALGAEDMIESLTEKNLELNERCENLRNTIEELETLKEINDELEENHKMREEQLTLDVRQLESTNIDNQNKLSKLERHNEYLEEAIAKYQSLVEALDKQLVEIKQTKKAAAAFASEDATDTSSTVSEDTIGHLRSATFRSGVDLMDFELKSFEHQQSIRQLEVTKCYLVPGFGNDEHAINYYLKLEKIHFLTGLLLSRFLERTDTTTSICFAFNDLLSEVSKVVSYYKHCSKEDFKVDTTTYEQFEAIEQWLDFEVEALRTGDTRESELNKSLEITINRVSKVSDSHSIPRLCETVELIRYCTQTVDILLKHGVLPNKFPDSKVFLQNIRATITRLSKDYDNSYKPIRGGSDRKRPNCLSAESVKSLSEVKYFLWSLARISSILDESDANYKESSLSDTTETVFHQRFESLEVLSPYLSEQFSSYKKQSNIQLTETEILPPSPWTVEAKDLNELKNQQDDMDAKIAQLTQELGSLALENRNKVKLIDELRANLDVSNAKLDKSKDQAKTISELKKSLADSQAKEQSLAAEMKELQVRMQKQQQALEKYQSTDIFDIGAPEMLADKIPKVTMMAQIQNLKAVIMQLTRAQNSGLKARIEGLGDLKCILENNGNVNRTLLYHNLYSNIRHATATHRLVDLSESKKRWQPRSKNRRLQYLSQTKNLQDINLAIASFIGH